MTGKIRNQSLNEAIVTRLMGTIGLAELQAIAILIQDNSQEKIGLSTIVSRVLWEGIASYKAKLVKSCEGAKP